MQTRFDAQAIADQCLDLIGANDDGGPNHMIDESGQVRIGIARNFSNHVSGRLKLHLHDGSVCSWRLPQHVVDSIAKLIRVQGNE